MRTGNRLFVSAKWVLLQVVAQRWDAVGVRFEFCLVNKGRQRRACVGNAPVQYGACGLHHRGSIMAPEFRSGDIDMDKFKQARTVATAMVIGSCISPACTAYASPLKGRSCNINGWSETASEDGSKVAVRATPSASGRISGRLPTDDRHYGGPKARHLAEFDIVETRNGWFRIANVRTIAIQDASYDAYPSKITGWIQPSSVRFNIQSSRGFAKPSSDSAVLVTSPDWIMDGWKGLYDCDGKWARVETVPADPDEPYPARELPQLKAWFRGVCGLSMIGCDDISGD